MLGDVRYAECDRDAEDEPIPLLDTDALLRCGELMFDLFVQSKTDVDDDEEDTDACRSSTGTRSVTGDTYMDLLVRKAFDWLYDLMAHDLEMADGNCYRSQPIRLYEDLGCFTQNARLRRMNRYVFGDGPCQDWDEDAARALDTVRTWRRRLDEETDAPVGLIGAYRAAAEDPGLRPNDVAMVAFAVLGFLQGYDTTVDFDILFGFRDVETACGPTTFRRVYNGALRHVRMFLTITVPDDVAELFEAIASSADTATMCRWIYDLVTGNPDALGKLVANPFDDGAKTLRDVNGKRMDRSYVILMRMLYRWASGELFALFGGASIDRDNPMLSKHVRLCLQGQLDEPSRSKWFDDVYVRAYRHIATVLRENNCPDSVWETFRVTCGEETFRDIIRLYVNSRLDLVFRYGHGETSTDSEDESDDHH